MYCDDDGNEIDITKIPMPELCLNCAKKDLPHEQILCNLNRLDQRADDGFQCGAYESRYGVLEDDIIV